VRPRARRAFIRQLVMKNQSYSLIFRNQPTEERARAKATFFGVVVILDAA